MRSYKQWILLVTLVALTACSEDWKDDVTALQKPLPSGLILLSDSAKVIKGGEFAIRFRTNPSGISLSKDSIELDAIKSDTYFKKEENGGAKSKASYVTPSDYMECVAVYPDSTADGKLPLEGQWVLRIKTKGEANFMNYTDFYLVLHYTDLQGKKQYVSSSNTMHVQILPTVDEGIFIGYSKAQSFRTPTLSSSDKILPYIVLTDCNFYVNNLAKEWIYDTTLIANVAVAQEVIDNKGVFDTHAKIGNGYVELMPTDHAKWNDFEKSTSDSISSPVTVTLTDIEGNTKTQAIQARYFKNELMITLTYSAAEINKLPDDVFYEDMQGALSRLGISPDYTHTGIRRRAITTAAMHSNMLDIILRDLSIEQDNWTDFVSSRLRLARLVNPVTPGEAQPGEEDAYYVRVHTYPWFFTLEPLQLFSAAIKFSLKITE